MKRWNMTLLALMVWVPGALAADRTLDLALPSMGDSAETHLSPEEDRRLGEAFMRNLRRSLTILDDAAVNEYIQSLGYRLAATSDAQGMSFTFFVVDDPTINAFAGPGGYIGVNTGLILATESESELAAVLAHEIAHVSQHHIARSVEKMDRMSLPSAAALLAAIVLATQSSEAGQAAIAATAAGTVQMQIDFVRANEKEADRVGIVALQRAGFDPRSMPGFFERLQQSIRYESGQVPEFLRTHPVTESRIADSRNRAEQYPYRQVRDSLSYQLLRAQLKVRSIRNPAEAVRDFSTALKSGQYSSREAARYGLALALMANRQYDAARTQLKGLLEEDPERIDYRIAQADLELAVGNTEKALTIYRNALKLYPGNPPLTVNYVNALLEADKPREARAVLQDYMRGRDPDPRLYKLLARTEGALKHAAPAHEAVAEYLYLTGDTRSAIQQLKIALRIKNLDFYSASRIEARLKEFEREAAQEKDS